ncbi:hypothetical protein [Nitratireductor sp. ZSWI3]|uniref:hypothetical protein n=1 Tax=Nitratireductor sp. ZSWI3 TaxID=2966359 RepID=UPI00214FE441|nr:hypothetical protein [Nitratireductor sp. ZSWI3]MCR4268611.1 hypothetical protein [Nitratireductor sp. ZSWI3]
MQSETALEVVQLELMLDLADLVTQGFEAALLAALDELDGRVLFNRRLDGDPRYQRVAAVALGPDDDIALVFLDHSGTATFTEDAHASAHVLAAEAIAAGAGAPD